MSSSGSPTVDWPTGKFGGELRLPVVPEARDGARLDGLKNEDRTLSDLLGTQFFGTVSPLVTEPTNNSIYESAHLTPLSANLCAFFL